MKTLNRVSKTLFGAVSLNLGNLFSKGNGSLCSKETLVETVFVDNYVVGNVDFATCQNFNDFIKNLVFFSKMPYNVINKATLL